MKCSQNVKIKKIMEKKMKMKMINRALSLLIATCFIFNSVCADASSVLRLAIPERNSDKLAAPTIITDDRHSDEGRILYVLKTAIVANPKFSGLDKDFYDLIKSANTYAKEIDNRDKTTNKASINFLKSEKFSLNLPGSVCITCKIGEDENSSKLYYIVISTEAGKNAPEITVCTEKEWKEGNHGAAWYIKEGKIAPSDVYKEDDHVKRVFRHIRQEETVDKVIRDAYKDGSAIRLTAEQFDFKGFIKEMVKNLNLSITAVKGVSELGDKDICIVKTPVDSNKLLVTVADAKGKETDVPCMTHSSNIAIHSFISGEDFDILTKQGKLSENEVMEREEAKNRLKLNIIHEFGVFGGQDIEILIGENDKILGIRNEVDKRYENWLKDGTRPEKTLNIEVQDLDKLLSRDHAFFGYFGKPLNIGTQLHNSYCAFLDLCGKKLAPKDESRLIEGIDSVCRGNKEKELIHLKYLFLRNREDIVKGEAEAISALKQY